MAPTEPKKNPRRILSFEALKNRTSSHSYDQHNGRATPTKPLALHQINEKGNIGIDDAPNDTWTGIDLVESPHLDGDESSSLRVASPPPERRAKSRKPPPLKFTRPTTPDGSSLASPSRARWEHLRQHVLPIPIRPETPPLQLPTGAAQTLPLPRAPTPKPSRLARLGFRQVVEQAREVALDDTRRFAIELEKVCWSIRFTEPHRVKVEATIGSSLHLPFMSNTSLATTGTSSVDNLSIGSHKKHEMRRPQSVQSLTTAYRSIPSVKPLYQTLLHHATPSADGVFPMPSLPLESLVLSTLLIPFLASERSSQSDDERWTSIAAFEVISRTWAPQNEVLGVERYLWCCKAAFIPPSSMRTRILSILWGLLIPTETNYAVTTPECFQTLVQGLFTLLPSLRPLSTSVTDQEEVSLLNDMLSKVRSGCCGEIETSFVQEEYNAVPSTKEDSNMLRGAMLLEALARCLEDCSDETRIWLFQNTLEQYWIKHHKGTQFTPLLSAIHARTLSGLSRAVFNLLSVPLDQAAYLLRAQCAAHLLQKRFIPDMDTLGNTVSMESRVYVANVVLELICMDRAKDPTRWGLSLLAQWYREQSVWRSCLDKTLREVVSNGTWSNIILKLSTLIRLLPDDTRKSMIAFVLPLLFDKLVEEPPAYPHVPLTNLLDTIARLYPQIFYKPLFSCAASSKEFTVVNYLCVIVVVAKFLPDFWIRDAEMISVALMSDVGGSMTTADSGRTWPKARLGQCVVMLELIGRIQAARNVKEALSNSDHTFVETVKFVVALESRIGILLDAKEQNAPLLPSQKLLFCMLLREMRLLTRSLKPAPWLTRVVAWYTDLGVEDDVGQDPEEEEHQTIGQIQGLYAAAQDGVRSTHQRRSTMLLSKSVEKMHHASKEDGANEKGADLAALFVAKQTLLLSLSKGFVAKVMKLLVAMSTLLTSNDYRRLSPYLWDQIDSDGDSSLTAAVCFLIMQCAEKTPMDILAVMEIDLQSSDERTKLNAVHRISILFNWRFQILSQHVVADRARRPFKLARGPLAFVATDIGSSTYIREDDPDELKDSLPLELRKRLAEIGWDQDDEPVNQEREWIKTPMSLLPTNQLDRLDNPMAGPQPPSPSSTAITSITSLSGNRIDEIGLLRRNSSSGGPVYGVKRRAVFVPSLTLIFPRLASLVFDPSFTVSSAAKHIILDLMRNDPALLSRPVLDLFAGEQKDIQAAILTIKAFLHVQGVLPFTIAHHLFNHIAGFLKYAARHDEDVDALRDFAYAVPLLSQLVSQVSGMSIRDIRRSKMEVFLIPSGSLWFPSSAPPGPMFPRSLGSRSNPFNTLPSDLVSMTMIRVSQNMLFLAMLKRNRQDVQIIRKNMSRLDLPSIDPYDNSPLELSDFVPHKAQKTADNAGLKSLSLMLSRSHLLLVAQVFRSMSRHLSDRNELSVLVDGLNRILLAHGDDIGIVSQVMIALMVASTRFRRLFTSGGGYALFMPAVIKVYAQSELHSGIKLAVEYAVNRFYALHQESFVFQTLDILAHIVALPNFETDRLVKSVYHLFFALRKGVPPSTPDAAGIHNANKLQEREALIVSTAEEKPQTFLSLLRRGDSKGEEHVTIELPEEYESSRLDIDNFVRLLLTVIAHDPTIVRAEQFLRLLRFLAPHLYHASSRARAVLQDGIDALGVVLLKTSSKPRGLDSFTQAQYDIGGETLLENQLLEKSRSASNAMAMRADYLALIVAFTRTGGQLPQPATVRTVELIRTMLKDFPMDTNNVISTFLTDFIRTSLLRDNPPNVKVVVALLQDLAPLISAHAAVSAIVDFSGVFQAIAELAAIPAYANEPLFSQVVVAQICTTGLAACEMAASANLLLSFPCRLSIVALLEQAVFVRGADVISELEKRTPSHDFLAGVILPLVVSLKTESHLDSNGVQAEMWHRNALGRAWVRILSYTMSAFNPRRSLERSRSQDKNRSNETKRSPLPAFIMALQVLKAIVVRAEDEVSSRLPGIWPRLASTLTKTLSEGNAIFATHPSDSSPLASPTPSPRTSVQYDPFRSSISGDLRRTSSHAKAFSSPRIIDYALWSFLELLCVHRNPLVLQMRLFTVEKVVELDHDLRHQENMYFNPHEPRTRRISTSVFSKPRRRLSGMPSPGSSPRLSPSQSFPHDTSFSTLDVNRQPGYDITSSPHDTGGPTIVHLGPISAVSAFGRALSGRRGKGTDAMATTTKIKSLTLVRATYRRIRTVQHCLGYEPLLPMPQHSLEMDSEEDFKTTWTRKEALDAIARETQELLEEFEESDRSLEDEGILVDGAQFGQL